MDGLTLLRVATMIVFLSAFAGIALHLWLAPRARAEGEARARAILDDGE